MFSADWSDRSDVSKKGGSMMKKKSTAFHAARTAVMIFLLLTIGTFSMSVIHDISTCLSLSQSIQSNEARRNELTKQKEDLETEKRNLSNPDYAEFVARGKYLVTKEGEQIFKFPAIDKNSASE